MLDGLQFPFQFNPELLQADLAKVLPGDWSPHYNERDYGGTWRGAALRSASGATNVLTAMPGGDSVFLDTPLMERCAYFQEVVSLFECPLKSVRLLSLAPGSFIKEHSDHALGYEDGEMRIHVPVQTNPGVEFYVAGERLALSEGQCYYVNVNLPHRVNNRGAAERVHLVIDAEVNDWMHGLVRRGRAGGWRIPRSPMPARGFEDFRDAVLAGPPLQTQLRAAATRTELIERAINLGRERGFDFNEADASAALRRPAAAGYAPALDAGWLPTQIAFRDAVPVAEWTFFGPRRFTEPFFADSVRACLRNPFAAMFRRELPLEAGAGFDSLAPTGFIYHMTRCGSTLIAQMLAALPDSIVISEAAPIDDILQAGSTVPDLAPETQVQWLRWVVAALGQRRTGAEKRYFIKLDAWNIHSLPLIRAAFPEIPWIFVHRDPLEVITSQLRRPGKPALPGALAPAMLGLENGDITALSREEWCAKMLGNLCRAALRHREDSNGAFVDYRQLPDALWTEIADYFRLHFSENDIALMREAARFDAKSPALFDREESRRQASERDSLLQRHYAPVLLELQKQLITTRVSGTISSNQAR